jgi:hypothetical protein
MRTLLISLFVLAFAGFAHAEKRTYGHVRLDGNSRTSGSLNPPGLADVMVCNVNGPDGFLSVRSGAGSNYTELRKMLRLAIVTVDSEQHYGHWIYVVDGYRNTTPQGEYLGYNKGLDVQGWVNDKYLCDFHYL